YDLGNITSYHKNLQLVVWQKPLSYTKGEQLSSEEITKEVETEHVEKEPKVEDVEMEHHTTPKLNRGKGIASYIDESPRKLVKATSKVRLNPDAPKAVEEAKLLEMNKSELIKLIHGEAAKAGVDPKILASVKGGYEFRKIQDAEIKVLNREHFEKIRKARELRGNDQRNFDVFNPFKFGDFGVIELDELGPIIQKKKNKVVGDLMTSLEKSKDKKDQTDDTMIYSGSATKLLFAQLYSPSTQLESYLHDVNKLPLGGENLVSDI
ncbi:hypothetical protein Tco_1415226, partial [Tanacetum coccineum]